MDHTELVRLGTLLHSHSWGDSREWARALGELAALSDADVDIAVSAADVSTPQRASALVAGAT
jgi:hypothetical protein